MKGALIYGQSGGPSAVINASGYGVITEAIKQENITDVLVMKNGIDGVLNENIYHLEDYEEQLELLKYTPGSGFGSVRHKLPSHLEDDTELKKVFEVLQKNNVKYFVYNGGNDSMDTCHKVSEYAKYIGYEMKVIGVPKTVDNDLPHTDHTPGFASAAKYIANTIMQIKLDSIAYPHGKVTVVEVMGRHAGWLTGAAGIGGIQDLGPDLIYLPEMVFEETDFLDRVNKIYNEKRQCLVVISEGIKDANGNFVGAMSKVVDAFGHSQLGGVALFVGDLVEEKLGIKYRSIELSTPQRSGGFLRSEVDVNEAIECGKKAVQFMINDISDKMVTIIRKENNPYSVEYSHIGLAHVANQEKKVPKSMYNTDTCQMTNEFYEYVLPLIQGEYQQKYTNGIQDFFLLKK